MNDAFVPRIIDRYALYERIAEGGMGSVHLGRLLGPLGFSRTVVIKRLHRNLAANPNLVKMLVDEARLSSRIHHANVVSTLEAVLADGELFLVMEYVAGESLARCLRAAAAAGTRVPLSVAVAILVGVLHGLHAAHEATDERGAPLAIVHRDVSPENILVGADGLARVLDFGIAKASVRLQRTTVSGDVKGKPLYVAPEQWMGERATRAADIYAAGLVLWRMIADRHPFQDADPVAAPYRAMEGIKEPPSQYARDPSGGPLPEEEALSLRRVDDIVMRALDLDPARRYPTASAMALELEKAVPTAPSTVSHWLKTVAADALSKRSQRVHEIEAQTLLPHSRPVATQFVGSNLPQPRTSPEKNDLAARALSLRAGDTAPEIDAKGTDGERFVLSRSPHRYTVVYFFRKAFTPDCTLEASLFRDRYRAISLANARIVGISTDDEATLRRFAASVEVPFRMIADADTSVSAAYRVLWPLIARPKRVTFIVGGARKILAVFRHEVEIARHVDDVLTFLDVRRSRRHAG